MILIGVEIGHNEPTTVVIVRPNDKNNRFTFLSIPAGTEFERVLFKVADLVDGLGAKPENVCAPRDPAFQQAVIDYFKRGERK